MKKVWQFKLTIAVTILVLVGMFMPGDDLPSVGIPYMDKVVHFGMFFCMAGAFYFEYVMSYAKKPSWWRILLVLLVFAVATELIQGMTDSRSCDVVDGMADMLGAITSLGLSHLIGDWWLGRQS